MISIRKREKETIIIQNFKREYLPIFSYLIGGYSILNFLSMIKVDINLSYKFFLVGFGITFLLNNIEKITIEKTKGGYDVLHPKSCVQDFGCSTIFY